MPKIPLYLFPAHAGMNRLYGLPERKTETVPRARGDEPRILQAQIAAQQFRDMAFREGEMLLVTPRRAKVFLDQAAGI